jgi:hypothetical protein
MVNILINKSHYDSSSRRFRYEFTSAQKFHNKKVTLQSLSIYNSFFNISSAYQNNYVTINFLGVDYSHTFNDGYYSISDINFALQKVMLEAKIYLTSSSGKNVYYIDLTENSIQYAAQLNVYQIPTQTTATANGLTIPVGAPFSLPTSFAVSPTLTFGSKFGSLLGMVAGTYPVDQTQDTQTTSTFSPQISVVNSLAFTCNLISNPSVSRPHDLFFATSLSASYGEQIRINPYPMYSEVRDGYYQYIEIGVLDQNLNVLELYDTDGNITITIANDEDRIKF